MKYPGWELQFFDKANNFRKYQYDLMKTFLKQSILEVGPGNGILMDQYIYKSSLDIVLSETDKELFKKISSKFTSKNNDTINLISEKGFFKTHPIKFRDKFLIDGFFAAQLQKNA